MILDDKVFEQITADDILALIPEVSESRRIDYKEALPDGNEKGVRSFLNDVCAMANSAGGFLVYGIAEARDEENNQTGNPEKVVGIGEVVADQVVQAWQQRITQAIEPRIIGHRVSVVSGFPDGQSVMLVYVQKSLFAPHRVNYQGKKEFYVRHDKCNLPMDIGEIRHAFVEAKEVPQRIDDYRRLRVSQILAGETPIELLINCPIFVCHVIPLSSFADDSSVDVTTLMQRHAMPLVGGNASGGRLNADGYLYSDGVGSDYHRGYVQVYRSGVIEMASTVARMGETDQRGVPTLASQWQEKEYIDFVNGTMEALRDLGVQPPVYICISLLRVKGTVMARPQRFWGSGDLIDKDILLIPTMTSETLAEPADRLMRPAFDIVWQASGLPASPYYNEEGDWTGER